MTLDERQHIDDEIKRVDQKIDRALTLLDAALLGFPEKYATKTEIEDTRFALEKVRSDEIGDVKDQLDSIRTDHVTRKEHDILVNTLSEYQGAQGSTRLWFGVVVAILGVTLGIVWKQQITHTDVAEQIKVESPWLNDKSDIDREISSLQSQNAALKVQVAQALAIAHLACRTKQNKFLVC